MGNRKITKDIRKTNIKLENHYIKIRSEQHDPSVTYSNSNSWMMEPEKPQNTIQRQTSIAI